MPRRRIKRRTEELTPKQLRASQLALMVVARLIDWHCHCPSRSCRAAGGCQAWDEERLCTMPITGNIQLMLAGIIAYGKVLGEFD